MDDLAFSGNSASQVIGLVVATLTKAGFRVSHRKIKRMGPGNRKLLNNLVLGKFVTVQKQYRGRIRAGIHNLRCGKVAADEIGAYVESLNGNINYLRLFDPRRAANLQQQAGSCLCQIGCGSVMMDARAPVTTDSSCVSRIATSR